MKTTTIRLENVNDFQWTIGCLEGNGHYQIPKKNMTKDTLNEELIVVVENENHVLALVNLFTNQGGYDLEAEEAMKEYPQVFELLDLETLKHLKNDTFSW